MKEILKSTIFCSAISVLGMMLGASILSFSLSGEPIQFLAGPIIFLFGWFYLPLVFVAVLAGWAIYNPKEWKRIRKISFVLAGGLIASLVFRQIGIKGPEEEWNYSYQLAGYIAGMFCFATIIAFKRRNLRDYLEEQLNQPKQSKVEPVATGQRR